jgi:hypothetical protein
MLRPTHQENRATQAIAVHNLPFETCRVLYSNDLYMLMQAEVQMYTCSDTTYQQQQLFKFPPTRLPAQEERDKQGLEEQQDPQFKKQCFG